MSISVIFFILITPTMLLSPGLYIALVGVSALLLLAEEDG
jgi:hypothetical protein